MRRPLKARIEVTRELQEQEYRERFAAMTGRQVIEALNCEVGNRGWAGSRALYLVALHDELDRRGYDYSAIGDRKSLSLRRKVKLVGKTIVPLVVEQ